jgi:hypothetical protein
MTGEEADKILFGDSLGCDELRPAAFHAVPLDQVELGVEAVRAEAFLHALALIEDSRVDETEEHGPSTLALNRIEAKVDVLSSLIGTLMKGVDQDPPCSLRWSAAGARLSDGGSFPAGTVGNLRIQPSDWLPQSLRIAATVLACDPSAGRGTLWLRFDALSPNLAMALERHLFRVHRREIAELRRPR